MSGCRRRGAELAVLFSFRVQPPPPLLTETYLRVVQGDPGPVIEDVLQAVFVAVLDGARGVCPHREWPTPGSSDDIGAEIRDGGRFFRNVREVVSASLVPGGLSIADTTLYHHMLFEDGGCTGGWTLDVDLASRGSRPLDAPPARAVVRALVATLQGAQRAIVRGYRVDHIHAALSVWKGRVGSAWVMAAMCAWAGAHYGDQAVGMFLQPAIRTESEPSGIPLCVASYLTRRE